MKLLEKETAIENNPTRHETQRYNSFTPIIYDSSDNCNVETIPPVMPTESTYSKSRRSYQPVNQFLGPSLGWDQDAGI